MNLKNPKIKMIISITVVVLVLGVIAILIAMLMPEKTNPYGNEVEIANYKDEVENLPDDRRQAIQAALHNTIKLNGITNLENIGSVIIRANSSTQEYKERGDTYSGGFIVDLENIRQSYQVTYSYSRNEKNNTGYSILVTCLPKEKLIYGEFDCTDTLKQEAGDVDPIIKFLPYSALTYSISPDSTSGKLILIVKLKIPQIDLSGNSESKKQTVALYKNEVRSWIRNHGLDPDTYTIKYNYSDNGNLIK